ncbi:MAG: VanZ family protein [Atopobiaceae bacterium]|nr:VanZ family protein [Atopobiaceae bacterium]
MGINIASASTTVFVTTLVAIMVFVMPLVDWLVCRHLGLNLQDGVSENPKADALLQLRQVVLIGIFAIYLVAVSYLVFFSRDAHVDYLVHTAIYEGAASAINIDLGFVDFLISIFKNGVPETLSHIHILRPYQVAELYLNIMLFVPMGYLLPYTFEWFRDRVNVRPIVASFLASLLIENVQLVTKHGYYDLNDLINNTLGGFIGQMLFIMVAYVLTHPNWRHDSLAYLRWRFRAHRRTLYPFVKSIALPRTTILATDEEAVWGFYVTKLGFRLRKQTLPLDSVETGFMFELGKSEVVILCSNQLEELPVQYLTISAKHLPKIRERLVKSGIAVSSFEQDPFTSRRCLWFEGPDRVRVTIIEG